MAVFDALLKIRAAVTGQGAVDALGNSLSGLNKTASNVAGGFKGLAGAAGGLVGGLGALMPLVTGAGLLGLAQKSIAGASAMYDLAQKTGVSVEMLSRFGKAAKVSGTDVDAVSGALIKLNKAIVAAGTAKGPDMAEKLRDDMKRAVDEIKNGERMQTDAVRAQADQRIDALNRESDARMKELNKRYRNEERLLNDKYDDIAHAEDKKREDRQDAEVRAAERRYEALRKALERDKSLSDDARQSALDGLRDRERDELEAIRDRYSEEARLRQRALRDQQQAQQDALNDRRSREEQALKASTERQTSAVRDGAARQTEAIKAAAAASIEALKPAAGAADGLTGGLDELGLSGEKAAQVFRDLGIAIKDQNGKMLTSDQVFLQIADRFKSLPDGVQKTAFAMKLFGKTGADMIPILNMGKDALMKYKGMKEQFAKQANEASDAMIVLQGQIGAFGGKLAVFLLPIMKSTTQGLGSLIDGFNKLPAPLQTFAGVVAGLLIALPALNFIVGTLVTSFGLLQGAIAAIAGLRIAALIAGWLPAMIAPFTGLLTWLSATFLPAVLAFFSGPVGWTVLAVAAVVAMAIAFRDPILRFLGWMRDQFGDAWKAVMAFTYDVFIKHWIELYNAVLRKPVDQMLQWMGQLWNNAASAISNSFRRIADAAKGPFLAVAGTVRNAINGVLSYIGQAINSSINSINVLIRAYNRLPTPDIPEVPTVQVPQFAQGGVVNRPTLLMAGEGGEPEYIVPESKMAAAASSYLAGVRGAAILSGGRNAPPVAPATISITTGPVIRDEQGQARVTMTDLERAMRATEAATLQRLRTPAGRRAVGIR